MGQFVIGQSVIGQLNKPITFKNCISNKPVTTLNITPCLATAAWFKKQIINQVSTLFTAFSSL